ncbi:MAG TPA: exopolyphosphatase [Pedobacter sp.]|jgi:exopolyphosphatase/guanosine-5'-triphosphate,3'-diphosphate pyrophosphatase
MSKRVAALDLGTNTFHLIIADVSEVEIQNIVFKEQRHVKLGEGGINEGKITEAALRRGMDALYAFHQSISQNKVDSIRAVGTAALRTAKNGFEFTQIVRHLTGINIEIIDGEREASLIYQGVNKAVNLIDTSLIMDIGGGSVEFIIADQYSIFWKKSYPIGAAKLMASFHHSDPISESDIHSIENYLDTVLEDLKSASAEFKPVKLVGSAGSFETFAELCQLRLQTHTPITKSFIFDADELESVISEIISSTHTERENNTLILPVRTDMIVVSSVLTKYVLRTLGIKNIELSTFALREGLLLD